MEGKEGNEVRKKARANGKPQSDCHDDERERRMVSADKLIPADEKYFKALRPSNMGYQAAKISQFPPSKFPATLARYALVFEMDNDWKVYAQDGETRAQSRLIAMPLLDKLRSADMIVQEFYGTGLNEYYVLVSITEKRQKMVAELMGPRIRLRMKKEDDQENTIKRDGAWMVFKQHLAQFYERCSEGTLFSSSQQCQMIEYLLNDEDVRALGPQLIQRESCEPGNTPLMQLKKDERIKDYFYMHHPDKLEWLKTHWCDSYTKRQPIEDIREYFGESVALYFAWMGYWLTMMWIPAMTGIVVFIMGLTAVATGKTFDSPYVPLFCNFISVWSVLVVSGWARLEQTFQYQWETSKYEEQTTDRPEFVQSKKTYKRLNELLEKEEYYPDPMWRWASLIWTCLVLPVLVGLNVALYIAADIFEKSLAASTGGPNGVMAYVGAVIHGLIFLGSGYVFENLILESLTSFENWQTEREHRDAKGAKYAFFYNTSAYFSFFLWGFIWNYSKVGDIEMGCLDKICYDYLVIKVPIFCLTIYAGKFIIGQVLGQAHIGQASGQANSGQSSIAQNEEVENQRPENFEIQATMPKLTDWDISGRYLSKTTEIGFVLLLSGAFPLMPLLFLLVQIYQIRLDAKAILEGHQRPPYRCTAGLGSINEFLEVIVIIGILTQCCVVAFASNGLLYYFPGMTTGDRILAGAVMEHLLLLFKILWQSNMSSVPDVVEIAYEKRKYEQSKLLEDFDTFDPNNDVVFYTSDDGEAFYRPKEASK